MPPANVTGETEPHGHRRKSNARRIRTRTFSDNDVSGRVAVAGELKSFRAVLYPEGKGNPAAKNVIFTSRSREIVGASPQRLHGLWTRMAVVKNNASGIAMWREKVVAFVGTVKKVSNGRWVLHDMRLVGDM